jgi:hypothetical protein
MEATRAEQINVEHFFRLLYELIFGDGGRVSLTGFESFLAQLWFWIVVIGYVLALLGFLLIIYVMVQLFELRKREAVFYSTLIAAPEQDGEQSSRWQHIQSLIESGNPSEWREAITEADIMLDDVLAEHGVVGDTLGDKLRGARFATVKEAGEAHGIRNRIAHEGSQFDLTETLAHRTMAQYEAVFREFKAI